jgi:hypothetical protein
MEHFAFDRGMTLRLIVSVLALVGFVLTLAIPRRELPFRVRPDATGGAVQPRRGMALPGGLRAGDRVLLSQQSMRMRAVLARTNVSGHRTCVFRMQRPRARLSRLRGRC